MKPKFSVVSGCDPWKPPDPWVPIVKAIRGGKIVHIKMSSHGYPNTVSCVHSMLKARGVSVVTLKNGRGIYVKAKK